MLKFDDRYDRSQMDETTYKRALAEQARRTHYAVASCDFDDINAGDSEVYKASQTLFKAAIKAAYPDQDESDIYDIWCDCMEDVAHCAEHAKLRKKDNYEISVWNGASIIE